MFTVIPACAGIYVVGIMTLDSGLRRNDGCKVAGMTIVGSPE